MTNKVVTEWKGDMAFDATVSGHHVMMDASEDVGGKDSGARPKQLMLAALAGCTGMDVVSILKKMKIEPEEFKIDVEGNLTEEHPKHYNKMHITYTFKGKNLEVEKIRKAIELSQEKYCGVSAVYQKTMPVTYEIVIL
jgi:putative redox protein